MSLIGRGATGAGQLDPFIAVKRARTGEDEQADHANEQRMFQFLENCSLIPYLIRCYYRRPEDKFLEFAPNGGIAMLPGARWHTSSQGFAISRLAGHSSLDEAASLAAAGLEQIGLVHGDSRPANMLLDVDWNMELSDLDRGVKIGEEIAVLTEPFGRLLDKEDGGGAGNYGKAGARTVTFAIYVVTSLMRLNLGAEISLSP